MTSASKDIQVKYFVDQNALIRYSMGSTGRCKKPLYWSSDCMGAQKHLEQLPLPLEIWKLRRYSMLFPWILLKQFTRAFDTCAFNNFRLRLPPAKRISFRWRGQSSLSGNTPVVPMPLICCEFWVRTSSNQACIRMLGFIHINTVRLPMPYTLYLPINVNKFDGFDVIDDVSSTIQAVHNLIILKPRC